MYELIYQKFSEALAWSERNFAEKFGIRNQVSNANGGNALYDNGRRICQHESQTFIYLSCNFARTSPVVDYDCHEELIFVLLFDIYAADHRSIVKNFGFCNFLASIICLRSCIFSVSWRSRPSQSLVFYFFSFLYFSLFSKRKKIQE